jgi:hypothetical protein
MATILPSLVAYNSDDSDKSLDGNKEEEQEEAENENDDRFLHLKPRKTELDPSIPSIAATISINAAPVVLYSVITSY